MWLIEKFYNLMALMNFGVLQALREKAIRVPDDIALVSSDDIPQAATTTFSLTTACQPMRQIGLLAIETLLNFLNNPSLQTQQIVLPMELIIRASYGSREIQQRLP